MHHKIHNALLYKQHLMARLAFAIQWQHNLHTSAVVVVWGRFRTRLTSKLISKWDRKCSTCWVWTNNYECNACWYREVEVVEISHNSLLSNIDFFKNAMYLSNYSLYVYIMVTLLFFLYLTSLPPLPTRLRNDFIYYYH